MSDAAAAPAPTTVTTPSNGAPAPAASAPDTPPVLDTPAPTPAEVRRHKVKIDGAEIEVDEPELLRGYERAKGAHKRFEEAAKARKEADALRADLEAVVRDVRDPKNRRAAIAHLLGGDDALHEFAESLIVERLERDAMPKEERERREKMTARERAIEAEEAKLAAREAAVKKQREAETTAEAKRLQEQWVKEWPEILRKQGVPPSRHAISRMASVMRDAITHGADMSASEAAEIVAEEIRAEVRELASTSDGATLRALLGDHAAKVREAEIASVQAQPGRVPPKEQPPANGVRRVAAPVLTTEEIRRRYAR